MSDEKRKKGRPSKDAVLKNVFAVKLIKEMLTQGARPNDIALVLDVDRATIYRWMAKNKEFCDTLNNWRGQAVADVERSLYQQAMGYYTPPIPEYDKDGQITGYKREWVKANTVAAIFFLKNKDPKAWRTNPEGGGGEEFDLQIEYVKRSDVKAAKDIIEVASENVTNEQQTNHQEEN